LVSTVIAKIDGMRPGFQSPSWEPFVEDTPLGSVEIHV